MRGRDTEGEGVYVCVYERERGCVCVRVRARQRESSIVGIPVERARSISLVLHCGKGTRRLAVKTSICKPVVITTKAK